LRCASPSQHRYREGRHDAAPEAHQPMRSRRTLSEEHALAAAQGSGVMCKTRSVSRIRARVGMAKALASLSSRLISQAHAGRVPRRWRCLAGPHSQDAMDRLSPLLTAGRCAWNSRNYIGSSTHVDGHQRYGLRRREMIFSVLKRLSALLSENMSGGLWCCFKYIILATNTPFVDAWSGVALSYGPPPHPPSGANFAAHARTCAATRDPTARRRSQSAVANAPTSPQISSPQIAEPTRVLRPHLPTRRRLRGRTRR
jgi:hypothetical protein